MRGRSNLKLVCLMAQLALIAACSDAPQTMTSPTGVTRDIVAALNHGSSLKANPPTDLAPNNVTIGFRRPTLVFRNALTHVPVGLAYDIEVHAAGGHIAYARTIGESVEVSVHTLDAALARGQTYWWRVRARLGEELGPWSEFAVFQIAPRASEGAAPLPALAGPPTPAGPLPFAVPAECGPFGTGDRSACVIAMTTVSPWWPDCQAGSGVNCHRFTRSVAAALALHDHNWGIISKNPDEQQCNWDWCGPGDGSGYGEDVVAYHTGGGNWIGWDVIAGAGAPGARAHWSQVGGRRGGNDWRPVPPFP